MKIMKFGGTSVANAERIQRVCAIIRAAMRDRPVVIVSAVAGVTNALIELAHASRRDRRLTMVDNIRFMHRDILSGLALDPLLLDAEFKELEMLARTKQNNNKKTLDSFVSFGERLSAPIVAEALRAMGVRAKSFPAWDMGMITDEHFGSSEPLASSYAVLKKKIGSLKDIPVITGYIGKTKKGEITTLGRGGSDYTAAIIGAALKADVIQVWKEVDGIMSTDPRLVPHAKLLPELTFEEASELAYFGAKVLHPKTIVPAMKNGVPVQVLNTFSPAQSGTTIISGLGERRKKSSKIKALTFKKNVIAVHVHSPEFFDRNGLLARIFTLFNSHKTSIDVVSTSVTGISLTVDTDEYLDAIVRELETLGTVVVERGKAIICAVGGGVNAAGVTGRMFTVLGNNNIAVEMISQAALGVSITCVVHERDAEKAVRVLHDEYIPA